MLFHKSITLKDNFPLMFTLKLLYFSVKLCNCICPPRKMRFFVAVHRCIFCFWCGCCELVLSRLPLKSRA